MVQAVLQRYDRRHDVTRCQAPQSLLDLRLNDFLGPNCFALALFLVGLDDVAKVINIIDEDIIQFIDRRVDVAGDGDIDKKNGPIPARRSESSPLGSCR